MIQRRLTLAALLLICVSWSGWHARAQQMPPTNIIDGMSRLNTLGLEIQTTINNNLADALQEKNLTRFQGHLSDLRKKFPVLRTEITKTSTEADAIVARLGSQDPSRLSESQRNELNEARSARARCDELRTTYDALTDEVQQISQHSAVRTSDARTFAANTGWFRDRLHGMQARVGNLVTGVAEVGGGGTTGGGTSSSAVPGPMMQLENQTTDIWFRIGGTWLKPKDPPLRVRGDMVIVQAMAMTKNRDFVMNKPPTANTTIVDRSPYRFNFTVDAGAGTGEVTWEAKEEKYEWHAYGPPDSPPDVKITTTKRPTDTITFSAPSVRKERGQADKVFTLGVRGSMQWDYQRSGAMGNVKRTDFENFNGTLAVIVYAR